MVNNRHESCGERPRKDFNQKIPCAHCQVFTALVDWLERTGDWRVNVSVVIGLTIVAAVWIGSMAYVAAHGQPVFAYAMLAAALGGWPAIRRTLQRQLKKVAS